MGKRRADSRRRSRSLRREKGHVTTLRADPLPAEPPRARPTREAPRAAPARRPASTTAAAGPTTASTADRYQDGAYRRCNPTWHAEDSAWKARHIARMIASAGLRPRTVVEVGCGVGQVLAELQVLLPPQTLLTGYEPSDLAHARCQALQSERLRFVHAALPDDDDPADLLLVIDVLEHVEDPFAFLRSLRGRGRHLILHVPLDLSVQSLLRVTPLLEQRRRVGHLHAFTRETLLALLDDTGLRVVDWHYTSGSTELAHYRTGLARWLVWPRRVLGRLQPDLAARLLGGSSMLILAE